MLWLDHVCIYFCEDVQYVFCKNKIENFSEELDTRELLHATTSKTLNLRNVFWGLKYILIF
jgi:hypothetical protein